MFGMWKDILPNHAVDANPNELANKNRTRLWQEALSYAFPHAEDPNGKETYWRVFHLHGLRNRVSHMDSLLNVDVGSHMKDAFDLIESISPDLRSWLSGTSTVTSILRERPR